MSKPALRIRGITKRFGSLVANEAVDLDLARGEILALLGENGAGKTTLMNILFGHYVADEGSIEVADDTDTLGSLPAGSPGAALAAGIGMVHQHFALAESLSVTENVVLGTRSLLSPDLGLRMARRRLDTLMRESGLVVDPKRQVASLGVGEKQRVEILKVLYRGARILVLDEPTAVLAPPEAEQLFGVLRRLKTQGLSVIFISHKLGEVAALADRVAVLRAGRKVADQPVAGADKAALATLMVGHEVAPSRRLPRPPGPPLLVLDRVGVPGQRGRAGLIDASLTIHSGEILGIAGVSGNGQAQLAGLVAGLRSASHGTVRLGGEALASGPRGAIQAGIGRIPEDRHHEGVVGSLSVAENLALETLSSAAVQSWGFLRFGRMRDMAARVIAAYDIRCPGPEAAVRLLSGGNMQKVILARVLESAPRLVLADQPTRGLDIGAAGEVHRRLLDARGRGAGVLLISEDLDELLAISDRIAVLAEGRLSHPLPVEEVTLAELGLKMAGSRSDQDRAAA